MMTVVNGGNGTQAVGECPSGEPQVTEVEYTPSGKRLVHGFCDSRNTVLLRVLFRGVTYTPNTANSPLRLIGDSWTLAIDEITPIPEGGTYSITVSTDMLDGTTLTDTKVITLPSASDGEADPGFTSTVPDAPRTNGYSVLYGIANPFNIVHPSIAGQIQGNGMNRAYYDDGTGAVLAIPKLLVDMILILAGIMTICVVSVVSSLWRRRLN
jgi:hypothetical protein